MFLATVAVEIFRILVSPSDNQDKLIWEPEKSAYKLFRTLKKDFRQAESYNIAEQKHLWKVKWKLNLPNKIKVFTGERVRMVSLQELT